MWSAAARRLLDLAFLKDFMSPVLGHQLVVAIEARHLGPGFHETLWRSERGHITYQGRNQALPTTK